MNKLEKLQEKYASVILKTCLKIKKDQPLFISANYERIDFVRILANVALENGVKDIYFDLSDSYLKLSVLKNLKLEDLKQLQFWNKEKWNEYAKKGSAFVMLASEMPGLMKDVDPKLLSDLAIHALETQKEFNMLREKSEVPWCIAAVPTELWAKQLFPETENSLEKLWNTIFKICNITDENPEDTWKEKIKSLSKRCEKLNKYHFKTLVYQNDLGTDFKIDLPKKHIWASGKETLINGTDVLVNFPTEEVFTSPDCDSANGIVYSSKPLAYQDNIIEDFWIKFENGKAIDCGAKKGKEVLENIINSCKNSNKLGEVALVEYDSSISKTDIIFYETLYDENAACHLALGSAFSECIENGSKMSPNELIDNKINICTNHVDFMIGTKDLKITGITEDDTEVVIFESGNFTEEFKK